jgi:predicted lipid-binding transport protein (Tim44 family)
MWLPISVGNHTDYSGGTTGGGGTTFNYTGGGYSGSHSGGGLLSSFGPVGTVVILIVIIAVYIFMRKAKINFSNSNSFSGSQTSMQNQSMPVNSNEQITEAIRDHDEKFSKEKFLSFAEQVFVQLQEAWSERDWKKARPFESEELFNLHKSQLDAFIRDGTINKMDNVCVNESYFTEYNVEDEKEYLTVFMQTRYND